MAHLTPQQERVGHSKSRVIDSQQKQSGRTCREVPSVVVVVVVVVVELLVLVVVGGSVGGGRAVAVFVQGGNGCLLYTSPSPRD